MPGDESTKVVLSELGAATMTDALGTAATVTCGLRPLWQPVRLVGPAFTVEMCAGDNLALHRAVAEAPAGVVLVAATRGNSEVAVWGDVLSRIAASKGLAGLVIDAAIRDSNAIRALQFPVFSLGTTLTSPTKTDPGRLSCPIKIAGAEISPGDWIVADGDGVVVIPTVKLAATVRDAKVIQAREADMVRRAILGESTIAQLGLTALADCQERFVVGGRDS